MRRIESERASIMAVCRSAITRMRLAAATAACLAAVVAVSVPGPLAGQDATDWAPGTWAGILDLERAEGEDERASRPQEPTPPLPYDTEEVSFTNATAGLMLTGTVTIPDGVGPFPGVVLVSGAGAQDRKARCSATGRCW